VVEARTEDDCWARVTTTLVVAAARAGDKSAFAALVERHRGESWVYCDRMLGSFDESEER